MSSLHTPLDSSSGVVISSVFILVIVCAHLQNGEIVFFTSYNIIKMSRRHRRKIKMRFSLLVFFIQWIMVDAKKPLYRVLERLKHEIRNVEYGGVEGRKTEKQIKHFKRKPTTINDDEMQKNASAFQFTCTRFNLLSLDRLKMFTSWFFNQKNHHQNWTHVINIEVDLITWETEFAYFSIAAIIIKCWFIKFANVSQLSKRAVE